jgi:uncharacterized protein DUF3616
MRRIAFMLGVFLMPFNVCLVQPSMETQTIPLSEVSGAVNIGNDHVVLIADEGYQVKIVSNAEATFKAGDPGSFNNNMRSAASWTKGGKEILDDIEDVAWDDTRQAAFVITSHSRSKKQDNVPDPKANKPQRHKLARLILKAGNIEPPHQETDVLEEALKKFSFVSEAMKRPHQEGGDAGTFNIEGLAFDQKTRSLLIGLRSPTQEYDGKPCAVVLMLKNPHRLFDNRSALPEFDPQPRYLDLGGLGIRSMTYDTKRKGCWIIAGRSADPDTPSDQVFSSLWYWDLTTPNKQPQKAKADLFRLENLESVCLLDRGGKRNLLLISDDGGNNGSRYLWIPIPKLPSSN